MDIHFELLIIGKLLVSLLLGAIIGFERETHGIDAGIRTYAAVCIGAAIFTATAGHIDHDLGAASRIIANIITGIGFLGAGIIYRDRSSDTLHGLTTAATVWCTAAVGVAVGLDMFMVAIFSTLAICFLLSLQHQSWYMRWKKNMADKLVNKE